MRLKLKNFSALADFETDFSTGLNAIIGENGKGKSTLVDALYFALTGESIRRFNNDELITWGETECSVELEVLDIKIVRKINKQGNVTVVFTRGDTKLTRKIEVDEAILSYFGITDKSAFRQVFFAEQFKAVELLSATDADRRKVLSTLFGFGKLEKARASILELINAVYTDEVAEEVMESLSNRLKSAKEREERARKEAEAVAKDILSVDVLSTVQLTASARPTSVLDELKLKLKAAEDSVVGLEQTVQDFPAAPSQEETQAYGYYLNFVELSKELDKAFQEMELYGTPVTPSCEAISKQIAETVSDDAKIEHKIADLQSKKQLIADGRCPMTSGVPCADLIAMADPRRIDAEISQHLEIRARIAETRALLDKMFAEHREKEMKTAEVRSNYNKLRELIMPLQPYADFDHESYLKRLEESQKTDAERKRCLEQLGNQKQLVMRYRAEIDEAERAGVCDQDKIDEAIALLNTHNNAVARMPDLDRNATEAAAIVAESKTGLEVAETQNRRAAKGKEIVRVLTKVRTLLHNDNIPRMLINDALRTLNVAMTKQLDEFGFPYTVKWLSGGVLVFENDTGEDVPVRALSGGQQYVVLIALRCALVQMLGSTFPLFVLDEPTTGLDEKNRDSLARVLPQIEEALASYVSTVVVPTHDEALLGTANIVKIE